MPYELGQYVAAHNRRTRARQLVVPAMAAAQAANGLVRGAYNALPSFAERRIVAQAVRASHEPKNLDDDNAAFNLATTTTPQQFLVNGMAQGTTGSTRTGRQVKLDSFTLHYTLTTNGSNATDYVRVIVVSDRESRGAAMGITDLLAYNTSQADQINSTYNFDNVPSRFAVHYDEVHAFSTGAGSSGNWSSVAFVRRVVLQNRSTVHYYNTSAGTIVDIDSGAMFMFFIGTNGSAPTGAGFSTRLIYRDI